MLEVFISAVNQIPELSFKEVNSFRTNECTFKDSVTKDHYCICFDHMDSITYRIYALSDKLSSKERAYDIGVQLSSILPTCIQHDPKLRLKSLFSNITFKNKTRYFKPSQTEKKIGFHLKRLFYQKENIHRLLSFIPLYLFFQLFREIKEDSHAMAYGTFIFAISLCSPISFILQLIGFTMDAHENLQDYRLLNQKRAA